MSFEFALRLSEILLAIAVIQQSAEHWQASKDDRPLFAARIALCCALLAGAPSALVLVSLFVIGVLLLHRFAGPYNGGSDKMTLLITFCLALAHLAPSQAAQELAFGYLSMQLMLSYVISGLVKLQNPDWREGHALADVFRFSAYPVSEGLRVHADRQGTLRGASWGVMIFELAFPLVLLSPVLLVAGLVTAATFHLANACLFGLNRFLWIWLAAYPSLIWFQGRIVG